MRWALAFICLPLLGFQYNPPGRLQAGNEGAPMRAITPGMRFPLERAPAYANSKCTCPEGVEVAVGVSATRNYSYPWSDTCEPRRWEMPLCPGGTGHQGQDIRPATCADKVHWAVAAEAGQIVHIGSYSVFLVADSGRRHRYLHMAPETVPVRGSGSSVVSASVRSRTPTLTLKGTAWDDHSPPL